MIRDGKGVKAINGRYYSKGLDLREPAGGTRNRLLLRRSAISEPVSSTCCIVSPRCFRNDRRLLLPRLNEALAATSIEQLMACGSPESHGHSFLRLMALAAIVSRGPVPKERPDADISAAAFFCTGWAMNVFQFCDAYHSELSGSPISSVNPVSAAPSLRRRLKNVARPS